MLIHDGSEEDDDVSRFLNTLIVDQDELDGENQRQGLSICEISAWPQSPVEGLHFEYGESSGDTDSEVLQVQVKSFPALQFLISPGINSGLYLGSLQLKFEIKYFLFFSFSMLQHNQLPKVSSLSGEIARTKECMPSPMAQPPCASSQLSSINQHREETKQKGNVSNTNFTILSCITSQQKEKSVVIEVRR